MSKARNRRRARKRALRVKHGLTDTMAKRDSMSAASRKWGGGLDRE